MLSALDSSGKLHMFALQKQGGTPARSILWHIYLLCNIRLVMQALLVQGPLYLHMTNPYATLTIDT